MKKRLVALLLTAAMGCTLLAGCGSSDSDASGSAAGETGASEDSVVLKMAMISMGTNLEDAEEVEAAINEYIEPLIGATVDISWLDMGDYVNQVNLQLTSGEEIDIMPTFGAYVSMWYAQDALMPLDDLVEEYGQDIIEAVGEEYMEAGKIDGVQYDIPCVQSFSKSRGFYYKTEIAEQYDIDFSNVKTLDDLTEIFAQLHEADPSLVMVVANNPTDPQLELWDWDGLGDEYGVLMNSDDSLEVVDLYETDEYKELVTLMHEWYEAGYIQEDASTTSENMGTLLSMETTFGVIAKSWPGDLEEEEMVSGYELGYVELEPSTSTTADVTNAVMAISSTSQHPKKAMEFMNLLYTDSTLTNLLYYGIEGEHYQVVDEENGKEDYLDGQDMSSTTYVNRFQIGNQLLGYISVDDPDDLLTQIATSNENAEASPALGFSYDSSVVSNELAALDTVAAKYRRGLECGVLDPETELPKFIDELKSAGIDTVIEEKQNQLNEWAAAQE